MALQLNKSLVVRCDGSFRQGSATYGWTVRYANRLIGRGDGKSPPSVQGRYVEWDALLAALRSIRISRKTWNRLQPNKLVLLSDSKPMVMQLNGTCRCRSALTRNYRRLVRILLNDIGIPWVANWIPRTENTEADCLCNHARERMPQTI